jgi:hypothetical protein
VVHRTLSGSAPDTVRWHTRQSGAPDQGAFGCPYAPLFEPFLLIFLLTYGEPLVPVELINLGKLVSPIICVGQFNHQNYLGTRCKPNSLSICPQTQDIVQQMHKTKVQIVNMYMQSLNVHMSSP